ncbi:hypothetical protein ABZV65_19310 [Streptomyces bauhiniae]|uniref:hypothetical protein n=1 Tax=Streptomyces bauhiniae TaxID=2340725 RepID=UPI0033A84B56
MPAISIGSVEVDVVPNATGILGRLQDALVPPATAVGDEVGRIIGQRLVTHIAPAITDGIQNGARRARPAATRQGDETAGAFARSMRARLDAAFRSMPKLDISITATGADAELARLRARLESLSNKQIGVDIDAEFARAQVADIEERLRRLGAAHPNVAVRADTAAAIVELKAMREELDRLTADPTRIRVETDGAFGQRLRAQVEAAEKSLPNINLRADSSPAEAEIASLRAQLTALKDKKVGIDIDATTARAKLDEIQARLFRLSGQRAELQVGVDANSAQAALYNLGLRVDRLRGQRPSIDVRVDAAAAYAQLAGVQAAANALDAQSVDIDTSSSVSGMQLLVTAALAFGPALIPVLPVVAAGLGAVAASAVAAGAGIGGIALVAVPAFKQIGTVLQAQKAAQDAAANATLRGGQAASQGASKALQMAGAQQALATAQRNAARQISDAQRAVGDATRQAAQANEQAAQQVKQARQSLADAYAQAADRMSQANEQVASAEQDLISAQRSARQAQLDLTQARKDAEQQLEDLNDRLTDSVLSQRDAEIAFTEATNRRNAVLDNANATELDKQKALLAYDQAVQRLKEQTTETKRLKTETAAANKAGVEGSTTVKSAQDRLAQAQQDVKDKVTALGKAQANVTKTQIQNTKSIASAQEKLSEAQASVAETQRAGAESIARAQERVVQAQQSAADSIASAQRQIASASLSAAGGVDQAAIAQSKYQAELAKLSPAARATMNAYLGLRDAFGAWSKSLQPAVMPIFTRALDGIRRSLPALTPFVLEAAAAVTDLQDRFGRQMRAPFWQGFKRDLQGSVKSAVTGLGITFGNVFKGMAGVVDAFLPHMDGISGRMQRVTDKFANWGTGLKGSPGFERFLSFASEKGPILGQALKDISGAFLSIGQALAPFSGPLLMLLGGMAHAIDIIATHAPWMIQAIWLAVVATRAWAIAVGIFNFVMNQNPLVRIALLIGVLIAAVIYAYSHFAWFRTAVQAAWSGIQAAALWAWNTVLKPTFAAIWSGLQTLGRWAMWLWTNAISPAFHYISLAARILLTVIVVAVILPIVAAFKLLAWTGGWLWENALKPAFNAIAKAAGWLWNNAIKPAFNGIAGGAKWLYNNVIKPQFDLVRAAFDAAGKAGTWLWKNAIKPAFDGIGKAANWLYKNAIKPAWDSIVEAGKFAYEHGIKPIFNGWKNILKGLGSAFSSAVDAIKSAWDRVKSVSRKPVQYVVDVVYNNGIRGVWNKVASAFGAPKLPVFKFAQGGVMPGYTPGRDVHQFVSPTGGRLDLSGGEAIMRPEFTRAVGSGFVNSMNALARSRGAQGVKAALAPVFGGNPMMSTDRSLPYASGGIYPTQRFADGGVFGWVKSAASAVKGVGTAAWNNVKKGAGWLADTLEASARAGVNKVVNPLLTKFPGMDTRFGKMIRRIPTRIIDALFGYAKEGDKRSGGTVIGGPRIKAALSWAKTQAGKPYQWAGNGNPSWDCSGFMSAIESVIRGQKPHRRWATMAFSGHTAPPGWVYHGNSPFRIGITNAGVGHTAGTISGTNVESRGGAGVVVGSRARGYRDKLFGSWYGFQPGKYDTGGWMPPGMNLMFNGLGQPEAVLTPPQWNAIHGAATRGSDMPSGPMQFVGDLTLDSGEFLGKVRGEAQAVVTDSQNRLIQTLNAS